MNTYLKEEQLINFCQEDNNNLEQLIKESTSTTVVGLPGMGISFFLRYLATKNFAYFIHIDINELATPSKKDLFQALAYTLSGQIPNEDKILLLEEIKNHLQKLVQTHQRIVIIFNRFDRLQKIFDQSFFANLRSLRDIDKEKIVMIFAANKPLINLAEKYLTGGNLNMFSKSYYLKPFRKEDLTKLLQLNSPQFLKENIDQQLDLSGGHYQLLQLILKSEYQRNYLDDPLINLQLKEIYQHFNTKQQSQMRKIALNKPLPTVDYFLVKIGVVDQQQLFSPLLSKYITQNTILKLPAKEAQLFAQLNKHLGKLVSKEVLFEHLWPNDPDHQTDWALNSLIYRLKKNPLFIAKGYLLENYKKQGYVLHKN